VEKQKTKLRWALETTGALVGIFLISTLLILGAREQVKKNHVTYYKSATAVLLQGNALLPSPCVKVEASVKLTKDTVILSLPSDKLSGKPVKVTDEGVILVEQASGQLFAIARVYTPGLPKTPGNELFILIEPGIVIVLSQRGGCEDIHAFLETLAKGETKLEL